MKIITKYLFKTILSYVLLVMLFLFGLQIFVEFLHEFPSIGLGNYGLPQLLTCVFLMLPYDIYQFFPMASLLGTVIALGLLASHSELIVMRVSGMSLTNIASAILKVAMVLLLIVIVLGEVLSPMAQRKAAKIKTIAISGGQALLTRQGVWLYNNRDVININLVTSNGELQGITRYQFGNDLELKLASHADSGMYQDGKWVLDNVIQTDFKDTALTSSNVSKEQLDLKFSPKLIKIGYEDPDQKNLFALNSYIKYRLQSGLDATSYEFSFWQRVFAPLATLVMILLAIPFVFGSLRSATMGFRMLTGVMAGFAFYMLYQFVGPMSVVYQIPPMLAALLPSLIFAVIGWVLLLRVR
ncbi:MAG: LPS export ABC transporter permease LptG [Gammaproteobacteria bacterium]|nr:LPS export ABC transporter permease LptG [Gammaproteobacteria bacterium]